MDVWHVIPTTDPGGNEVFAKSLIIDFPIKANHSIFSTTNIDGILAKDFQAIARLGRLFNEKNIKIIPRTIRLFNRNKPDAIIIHTFNTSLFFFILVAKFFRIKKIIITVGNPPPKEFLLKLRIYLIFLRFFKVPLVFCSKFVQSEFEKNFKLPIKSLNIRNGCKPIKEEFSKNFFKDKLFDPRKLTITMVSRLDDIKDHETLIKAFLSINDCAWDLILVGEGYKKDHLEKLVNKLNGNNNIKFLGSRNDVPKILSNTNIFAFSTTFKEGFGIVLVEALSLGIPIIASDVPACREVLINGEGGILVTPGNVKLWKEKLSLLMYSENKRSYFAKKAKKTFEFYDIKLVAKEYFQLLESI